MKRTKFMSYVGLIIFSLILNSFLIEGKAAVLKDLKVEYMKNPIGIDVSNPRFSWKMESDVRGAAQTAYQIVVSTDQQSENIVWDSGKTDSDKSVHIKYEGTALSAMTRYYWHLKVWDENGFETENNEIAFFETGLMDGGWSDAAWIKLSEENGQDDLIKFDLEMDMILVNQSAGIVFSAHDAKSFYMWAVIVDDSNSPILRRHYFNGNGVNTSEIRIGDFITKSELLNQERRVKIEVDNNVVKTYIDDTLVDTYTDQYNRLIAGGIGFRAYNGGGTDEVAYYDNISYMEYVENQPVVRLNENFETNAMTFEGAENIVLNGNTKLKMFSRSAANVLFDESLSSTNLFRTEFSLGKEIQSAKILTSALGVYDLFINGERVGRNDDNNTVVYDELKPGWTNYNKTIFYSYYDVTSYLTQGQNAIGAQVGSGWWNGSIASGQYGNLPLGFIAKLVIEYSDGSSETIATHPDTWKACNDGPIKVSGIYDGESYDARKESNWTKPDFDASNWKSVVASSDFKGSIKALAGPPVQIRTELQRTPIKITQYENIKQTGTTYGEIDVTASYDSPVSISLKQGETVVYDLGQNMVGWVKFKVRGNSGAKMKIRFAEMLNDTGDAQRANDGPGGSLYTAALRGARASLYYTLKGESEGEVFNPSTTFFGFRYCEVTASQDVDIEWLVGEVVGTVATEGSGVTTSNSLVNQLYSNIMWGQRGNFLSIPTDCPQRDERLGWSGDIQVFGRAATYNADLAAFFHKWMDDMRDSQRDDGAYPDVAPHTLVGWGQAAWGDAGIIVPWNVYLMYDNIRLLEENYVSMERHMNFLKAQKGDNFLYNGGGTDYGDWVAPVGTNSRYVSVCYYAYTALIMQKVSNALSKATNNNLYAQKATVYQTLYRNIKREFQARYINTDGTLNQSTQTTYLLALKLDLFPNEESTADAVKALQRIIISNGNRISTGFVGTGIINQTLSEVGLTDLAYNLLLQRNNPSWLYSVDQGATTIWERWDSYTKEGGFNPITAMNSFNHYAYGTVSEWMYRYMAGINPDEDNPGFKHINITPNPDFRIAFPSGQKQITSVDATYASYYGDVKSAWQIEKSGVVKYSISVPANTTGTVVLPLNSDNNTVVENNKPLSEVEGVISYNTDGKLIVIKIKSGDYVFEVKKKDETSINKVKEYSLDVYPNPVSNKLNIDSDEAIKDIGIYNLSGIKIHSQKTDVDVDMSYYPQGVYFLHVNFAKALPKVVKVIKK